MNDTDLDYMIEKEAMCAWEEQNRVTDGESLRQAAKALQFAIEDLDTSADWVNEAAEILVDTPEGDKVASILEEMERILKDLKTMHDKWEKGWDK